MPERSVYIKDQKPATRVEAVRKPPVKKPVVKTGRPIETILTGTWNAVKKPPEWLGKKTVDLYDKLRFPKLTPEEKKMQDKFHAMLRKHYKAVGWTETAVAAGITTWAVVKGYRRIKEGKKLNPGVRGSATDEIRHATLTTVQSDLFKAIDGLEKYKKSDPRAKKDVATVIALFLTGEKSENIQSLLNQAKRETGEEQQISLQLACIKHLTEVFTAVSDDGAVNMVDVLSIAGCWRSVGFVGADQLGITLKS